VQNGSFREFDVAIRDPVDGVTLAGTLTLPTSPGRYPAALLLPGSGPRDRDEGVLGHRPFRLLAEHLSRLGLVVLRMDKRGCGASGGTFVPFAVDQAVHDARIEIDFLRDHDEIDPHRIGLIGHSEGALLGSILAGGSDPAAFLVLLAAPGVLGRDFFCLRWTAMAEASGQDDSGLARVAELCEKMPPLWVRDPVSTSEEDEARRTLEEVLDYIEPDPFAPEDFLSVVRIPTFRDVIKRDPREMLRRVSCPVLAMTGDKDVHVPAEANLSAIREALETGGNERYRIVEVAGLNHLFQLASTGLPSEWAESGECMSPPTLNTITDWLVDVGIIEESTTGEGSRIDGPSED